MKKTILRYVFQSSLICTSLIATTTLHATSNPVAYRLSEDYPFVKSLEHSFDFIRESANRLPEFDLLRLLDPNATSDSPPITNTMRYELALATLHARSFLHDSMDGSELFITPLNQTAEEHRGDIYAYNHRFGFGFDENGSETLLHPDDPASVHTIKLFGIAMQSLPLGGHSIQMLHTLASDQITDSFLSSADLMVIEGSDPGSNTPWVWLDGFHHGDDQQRNDQLALFAAHDKRHGQQLDERSQFLNVVLLQHQVKRLLPLLTEDIKQNDNEDEIVKRQTAALRAIAHVGNEISISFFDKIKFDTSEGRAFRNYMAMQAYALFGGLHEISMAAATRRDVGEHPVVPQPPFKHVVDAKTVRERDYGLTAQPFTVATSLHIAEDSSNVHRIDEQMKVHPSGGPIEVVQTLHRRNGSPLLTRENGGHIFYHPPAGEPRRLLEHR